MSKVYNTKDEIFTFDFLIGKMTKRNYTKAKIVDMIGFTAGQNN